MSQIYQNNVASPFRHMMRGGAVRKPKARANPVLIDQTGQYNKPVRAMIAGAKKRQPMQAAAMGATPWQPSQPLLTAVANTQKGGSFSWTGFDKVARDYRDYKNKKLAGKGRAWLGLYPEKNYVTQPVKKNPMMAGMKRKTIRGGALGMTVSRRAPPTRSVMQPAQPKDSFLTKVKRVAGKIHDGVKEWKVISRALKLGKMYYDNKKSSNPAEEKSNKDWSDKLSGWANNAELAGYGKKRGRKMRGGDFLGIGNFFRNKVPNAFKRFGNDVANAGKTVYNKALKPAYEKGLKPAGEYIYKHPLSAVSGLTGALGYIPTPFSGALKGISAATGAAGTLTGKGRRKGVAKRKKAPAKKKRTVRRK
jgi:hypothetical protein